MPGEEFDLEILHHILGHFSKDVAGDCLKVIENLLKSQLELNLNKSLNSENNKTFACIKVLLSLYEKLSSNDNKVLTELPVSVLVQTLKCAVHCSGENCNLPATNVQCNILSIVCSLFKNVMLQNSQKNQEEVAEFYLYILTLLDTAEQCKSDCLIFKLKVLSSIYHAFTLLPFMVINEFIKKIESIKNFDECKLFANLVLFHNEDVAIQTLMYLIPEYVNCFKNERVVEVVWKQISNTVTDNKNDYFRVLIIVCNLFDICCNKSKADDKIDLSNLLLQDVKYWKLVQVSLVEKDPVKRKQGMFLLKKSIDLLKTTNRNLVCSADDIIFYWDSDCKDDLEKIYSDLIICLEFLEEQQVHIIKPVLNVVETLGENIIKCEKVDWSWALLLYKKSLMHESTQIVKWGLTSFLKLPVKFFTHKCITKETVGLLVDTLSNMSLYYNNGLAISEELSNFFKKIAGSNGSQLFFNALIKEICSRVWSAEALFFVMHSLSNTQQFSSWGEEEISEITMFVSKAFKTHNKVIRVNIQCDLLKAVANFTDKEHVSLESLILLLSKFCLQEVNNRIVINYFCDWMRNSYSVQEADNILEKYKKIKVEENFNEKFVSAMIIFCHYVFYSKVENSPALNYLHKILSSFKEVDKRLYCDKLLYKRYFAVFCCILKISDTYLSPDIELIIPFIKDILHYIQTQFQEVSNLQDFSTLKMLFDTFQILCVLLFFNGIFNEFLENFCEIIIKDIEAYISSSLSINSIGIYWRIKLLYYMLMFYCADLKSSLWGTYLLNHINEPLMKDDTEMTRDLQILWGRINSEFIEAKWIIFYYICKKNKSDGNQSFVIDNDTVIKLSIEALNSGGYEVLNSIMPFLADLLPVLEISSDIRKLIDSIWKLIMERRKTEEFKFFITCFVEFLYQEAFILRGMPAQEILFDYADLLFSDSSLDVINIFMKHIKKINLVKCSVPLFCHVVGKGLIFGPVQKKDKRLTNQICSHIEFLNNDSTGKIGNHDASNKIRAIAVQMIVVLKPTSPTDQTTAKSLIKTLLKMEKEINKSKTRYFANTHVHRVKHRLMQSLLLLEPMLIPNEVDAQELSNWVYHCLTTENSQPSVRYQQEWLLVRMLVRHSELYSRYCISNYKKEFEDNNKRGLCSGIAVSYHLCKLSPPALMEGRIVETMNEVFSFCFHQHFEVRLHSQVVFHKLYDFAKSKNLEKVTKKFREINDSLASVFQTHLKGNYGKNLEKMLEDFYFSKFNPLEHYSLETIYMDLPRLTNVDSDEWISTETFRDCFSSVIPKKNAKKNCFTDYFPDEKKWLVDRFSSGELTDGKRENPEGNYQKKIIPQKPLIPGWDENGGVEKDDARKDGLIVVASLIDRIPNLGGLARTCEILGASEYVLGSLKYTEDKQFTSLSVTAEKWITIKEVKVQNLFYYISEMKQEGYTVIGAEQMLRSVPLSAARFPKKSLLLLGNEKEGIPPNLLPLVDIWIEIPQLGIIRSLNVHVTGALFIWEYAKQNHFS